MRFDLNKLDPMPMVLKRAVAPVVRKRCAELEDALLASTGAANACAEALADMHATGTGVLHVGVDYGGDRAVTTVVRKDACGIMHVVSTPCTDSPSFVEKMYARGHTARTYDWGRTLEAMRQRMLDQPMANDADLWRAAEAIRRQILAQMESNRALSSGSGLGLLFKAHKKIEQHVFGRQSRFGPDMRWAARMGDAYMEPSAVGIPIKHTDCGTTVLVFVGATYPPSRNSIPRSSDFALPDGRPLPFGSARIFCCPGCGKKVGIRRAPGSMEIEAARLIT